MNVCSEQTHVTCNKSPETVVVSISSSTPSIVLSSAPTNELHTTVGNLLPQMFDTRVASLPSSMAAGLGIGLAEFSICIVYCCKLLV